MKVLTDFDLSERSACRLVDIDRSTHRYRAVPAKDGELRSLVKEPANKYRRFGCRRLHQKVLTAGVPANHKRVQHIYQEEGLQVRRCRRKKVKFLRQPMTAATAPKQVWYGDPDRLDFVWDRTVKGKPLKFFVVLDDFTKELFLLEPAPTPGSLDVIRFLDDAVVWHGKPQTIRSDTGAEFTSSRFINWTHDQHINRSLIQPGRPMQNLMIESLNG